MSKEIGTLVVVVLKARNLRDKHTIHKQDAYAQATLNKSTKKTKVDVRGGQHPVWDEELRFPIFKDVSDETRKLEVSCYSKEPRSDDLIAHGSIDISDTLKTGEFDDWIPLKTEDGQHRGDIFLEMTFYSAAPPPQRRPSKWISADRLKRPIPTNTSIPSPLDAGSKLNGHKLNGHKTPIPNAQSLAAVLKDDFLPPLPEEPTSAPASAPSIPAILRPGGGAPPRTSPPKSNTGLLPPEHPVHTHAPYTPPRDPSPPAPVRVSLRPSLDSVPPYLRPAGGAAAVNPPPQSYTPTIPEPQIPAPEIPASYGSPPRLYVSTPVPQAPPYASPQTQPYSVSQFPPYPVSSAQAYSAPQAPPYSVPPAQSYPPTQAQPHPTQTYPIPQAPSYPAPRYGSPPREYGHSHYSVPPATDYGPYGGAAAPPFRPPQVQIPSHPQPYPPYGGSGYSDGWERERERGPELPDPYLQARYQSPLPLPEGARASTPTHRFPQPHTPQPQPHLQPQAQAPPQPQPQSPAHPQLQITQPAAAKKPPSPSREERDRQLALEYEKEDAERRRKLREQEEHDLELARQLDLELNLEGDASQAGAAAPGTPSRAQAATAAMPGTW